MNVATHRVMTAPVYVKTWNGNDPIREQIETKHNDYYTWDRIIYGEWLCLPGNLDAVMEIFKRGYSEPIMSIEELMVLTRDK